MRIDFIKVYKDRLVQVEEGLKINAKNKRWQDYYRLKKEKEKIVKWLEEREK